MTEQFRDYEPLYKQGWNDEHKLLLKLSSILGEVGAIPKTGINKFHGYHYHTEADINSAFQKHFSQHKIMFSASMIDSEMRTTTTANGKTEYIYKANMRFTFFDAETGESLTGCMSGEGQDNGDKALYKSISGTQKYILMKTFMVTDHNDPEGDHGVDERNSKGTQNPPQSTSPQAQSQSTTAPPTTATNGAKLASEGQAKMLYAKAKQAEIEFPEISSFLKRTVTKMQEVEFSEVNGLIKWLDEHKAA